MSKKEIEFVVSYDVKTGKTTRHDNRFDAVRELVKDPSLRVTDIAMKTGYNKGHVSRLRQQATKKEWVSLTDEEVSDAIDDVLQGGGWLDVARALEAAIKEKNHG